MTGAAESTEVEVFKEDMDANVKIVADNLSLLDEHEQEFAENLCIFYQEKGYLSAKQMQCMIRFWQQVNSNL